MTVHDASPQDIYIDAAGKLWRVVSICHEPTVTVEEIEKTTDNPYANRVRKSGGVSGLMWDGFKRIYKWEQK